MVQCYHRLVNPGKRGWVAGVAGVAIVATAAGAVRAAGADDLEFAIGQGRVTVIATGVPLGDVLAEWARAGTTRFEGVGALGGLPVSLHLDGVAEREALRLLLRPAAGFLAAPRAPDVSGASIYDRVKIRAARREPQPAAASASQGRPPPPRPVREAPPALSEAAQRERLQRLLRPRVGGEAATSAAAEATRGGAVYAPTTPRPGMMVEPEIPDPPSSRAGSRPGAGSGPRRGRLSRQ